MSSSDFSQNSVWLYKTLEVNICLHIYMCIVQIYMYLDINIRLHKFQLCLHKFPFLGSFFAGGWMIFRQIWWQIWWYLDRYLQFEIICLNMLEKCSLKWTERFWMRPWQAFWIWIDVSSLRALLKLKLFDNCFSATKRALIIPSTVLYCKKKLTNEVLDQHMYSPIKSRSQSLFHQVNVYCIT